MGASDTRPIFWKVMDLKHGDVAATTDNKAEAVEWRKEVERGEWGEVAWTGFNTEGLPVGDYVKHGEVPVEHVWDAENIYANDTDRLRALAEEFFHLMPPSGGQRQAMWRALRQVMGQAWLNEMIQRDNEIDRAMREREG